jgi:hypothetical protein
MKRFLALASAAIVLSASTTLVAGSIVINAQPAQAEHEVVN